MNTGIENHTFLKETVFLIKLLLKKNRKISCGTKKT